MAFEFKLPDIGEGVVEGEIVKWLVKPGDSVAEDQPMVEVMTDKATVVIPSPKKGTVLETRGKEGGIAKVGEVLVVIDDGGAKPAPVAAAPVAAAPAAAAPVAAAPVAPAPVAAAPAPALVPSRPVLAAPATRRLARELGLDITRLEGSGPGGRVTAEDVRRAQAPAAPVAAATSTAAPAAAAPAPEAPRALPPVPPPPRAAEQSLEERIPVRGLRKRIWENMQRSKANATHFTFVEECDATNLVAARDRMNGVLADGEAKLQYLPFIVKAVVAALKRFPDLNGHVDEGAHEFVRRKDIHIGIAAASERGLIVPVLRNADRLSLLEVSAEIKRMGDLARAGRLGAEDLGGSTFTITSLGKDGGIFATPIINHPEVAIMGVHKMAKRPMVDDHDAIVVRHMMNLSLSFDHRLVDGHIGAAFTYAVIRLLQSPDRLFLEMT
jgi:pyruvate dehydrogenase E2 component (dihydrolipoamide acetyltransferase)